MNEVDFAEKLPCPNCGELVRVFFASYSPTKPWWCKWCLKNKIRKALGLEPL